MSGEGVLRGRGRKSPLKANTRAWFLRGGCRDIHVLRVTCRLSALGGPCLKKRLISQDIWEPPFSMEHTVTYVLRRPHYSEGWVERNSNLVFRQGEVTRVSKEMRGP